jgi:hypothetical protein
MEELDIQLLISCYNDKMGKLINELVVKEAVIKQLERKVQALMAASKPHKLAAEDLEE